MGERCNQEFIPACWQVGVLSISGEAKCLNILQVCCFLFPNTWYDWMFLVQIFQIEDVSTSTVKKISNIYRPFIHTDTKCWDSNAAVNETWLCSPAPPAELYTFKKCPNWEMLNFMQISLDKLQVTAKAVSMGILLIPAEMEAQSCLLLYWRKTWGKTDEGKTENLL